MLKNPSLELGTSYLPGEHSNHYTTMPGECIGELIIKDLFNANF